MKLYFLRHAEAEDGVGKSDHDRELTARGQERIANAARVIAKLELKPAHLYSSPRVRAVQTAEPVAKALGLKVEIREEVNYPAFNAKAVKKLIEGLGGNAEVMFVGHEPTFSETVGELTGAKVEMKKGGLARVDVVPSQWFQGTLIWLITPGVFDMLSED